MTLLDEYNWNNEKVRHILIDVVKYHLLPHVTRKNHAHKMWASLIRLFQDDNEKLKMVLRKKLRDIKMTKTKDVSSYLTCIT